MLQKPEGNPGRTRQTKACIQTKQRLAAFCLPPGSDFTTSNQDNILVLLGDSGAYTATPLVNSSDKNNLALNNVALSHAIKAEAPHLTGLFIAVQPKWGILQMVEWLEEMFGKEALEIENNPDLGCFTLIVESACKEMVNKE